MSSDAAAPRTSDRAHPGTLDVVGFVLAIVIPIAGLVVSLVALGRARRLRPLRTPAITLSAVPISIVLLVLQLAGTIFGVALLARSVEASYDQQECHALARYPDLLAADGPASLEGLTQQGWTARLDTIGTWHSQFLELTFDLPNQMADTDPFAVAVQALRDRTDPTTGWTGKTWTGVAQDVTTIRDWRDAHCG